MGKNALILIYEKNVRKANFVVYDKRDLSIFKYSLKLLSS